MKVVIFGLGNFGMSLALHLADSDNEVVVADRDPDKIDLIKDKVSHAVVMDATNEVAYRALPLKGTDRVVIGIGDNKGSAIMITAVAKKMCDAKIIARSSSSLQDTIFEAMGIDQIVHPEQEYAERLTKTMNLKGSIENFEIDSKYLVSEVEINEDMVGKTLEEVKLLDKYKLNIVTVIREIRGYANLIHLRTHKKEVVGIPSPQLVLKENDVLVVFGKSNHINKYLKETHGEELE